MGLVILQQLLVVGGWCLVEKVFAVGGLEYRTLQSQGFYTSIDDHS
jgi:hypothetical protein